MGAAGILTAECFACKEGGLYNIIQFYMKQPEQPIVSSEYPQVSLNWSTFNWIKMITT